MGASMNEWLALAAGGLLLYFGAEWFVGGASALALTLRVPQLIVGLTVVAYGTSAPELIVGIQAAVEGRGEVALGNVIGSNIVNVGLILGLAALVRPARVDASLRRRELPVLMLSAALLPTTLVDGRIAGWEAGALLLLAFAYTAWMVRATRATHAVGQARVDAMVTANAADAAGAPATKGLARSSVVAAVGLLVLLVGGNVFVGAAVDVARNLGMSDRLVGLTIVAVGTSLPELVTSVIAAARGHSDIAIGNVVGSNIFNVFLCLGGAALVGSVGADIRHVAVELAMMVLMTLLAAAFIRSERVISRAEGGVALAAYVLFTLFVISHA
jgi:cation:H+ antiporter